MPFKGPFGLVEIPTPREFLDTLLGPPVTPIGAELRMSPRVRDSFFEDRVNCKFLSEEEEFCRFFSNPKKAKGPYATRDCYLATRSNQERRDKLALPEPNAGTKLARLRAPRETIVCEGRVAPVEPSTGGAQQTFFPDLKGVDFDSLTDLGFVPTEFEARVNQMLEAMRLRDRQH